MKKVTSPWRYPGGKSRLSKKIFEHINDYKWDAFVEPFAGGGGFTFAALTRTQLGSRVALNDADPRVAAWWEAVALGSDSEFDRLCEMLSDYNPTVKDFYSIRKNGLKSGRLVERAFAAIATNRCSFSGLLDGGPIGGTEQKSKYTVDCRYNKDKLIKLHTLARETLQQFDVSVSSKDFREFLKNAPTNNAFLYLDPPYVKVGAQLYPTAFDYQDHEDLADFIDAYDMSWAASYDDDPWVRQRFAQYNIIDLSVRYTISPVKRHTSELLIIPTAHCNTDYSVESSPSLSV